ncbi:MAG TPA: ribosome maturation factor RimM [Xanthobacteraceae bacterium]|nr:ribosome maturation factor RimM [Xanthobacteraceae bacterium]
MCVGQLGAPHGVRGDVRLKSFTADPLAIGRYGPLESEDGRQTFRILGLRRAKDMLIARLEGVADRTAAERLRNLRLYVPRDRLPAPEDDEFYHADLIGLAVTDRGGERLGTVVAVQNFGAGDLIEIAPQGASATVLLPFTRAVVPEVDLRAGRLVVEPPEGAFEAPSVGSSPARPAARTSR